MTKHILNSCLAFLLLIASIIPMALIALWIKTTTRGPILYWSKRVGQSNVLFNMPKFCTMKLNTPNVPTHKLLKPEQYLTPVGTVLRKFSFDELPQLFSIIKGDMKFIGPRPALPSQINLLKLRKQYHIDLLTPGLTGWAQVNGRDSIDMVTKVNFEQEYLTHKSLSFDLKILWLTALKVMQKKNISH